MFYKVLEDLARTIQTPKRWMPYVIWAHGPTGSGKSLLARNILPESTFVKTEGKLFLGYEGQPKTNKAMYNSNETVPVSFTSFYSQVKGSSHELEGKLRSLFHNDDDTAAAKEKADVSHRRSLLRQPVHQELPHGVVKLRPGGIFSFSSSVCYV